jgi:hypothetical protein
VASIFRTATPAVQNTTDPVAASGVSVQSSVFGKPIPLVYGTTRLSGNMILYGNFYSVQVASPTTPTGGGGGKGSMFGSGGSQQQTPPSYTFNYFAAFAFAMCEGPVQNIGTIWQGLSQFTAADLGFSFFSGTYPQGAWGTTVSWSVTDANGITTSGTSSPLGYNGLAYVAASNYALGSSTSVPNLGYEIFGVYSNSVGGQEDADPSLVLNDFMTNANYGAGFPSGLVGNLSTYQSYCLAAGLLISPCYDTQRTVSDMIDELMAATNSNCFWSSGVFQVVPYGDSALSGNGANYTPPSQPEYSLTDDDFMENPQNNIGASATAGTAGPLLLTRKRKSDTINSIKIEYLDRSNSYNPAVAYAENQAEIDSYGKRTNGTKSLHMFCNGTSANLSAHLQLRRQLITNTYHFDLDQRYILLDPMDIISITDSGLGLVDQWVRITSIIENDDGTLSFTAEDYLNGTGAAPAYTFATQQGPKLVNINAPAGQINAPYFFEPPYALNGALEVYGAISGGTNWGGADVWVSTDGLNYQFSQRIIGGSRMGSLTFLFPTIQASPYGQTIDQTNQLDVDLTISSGALATASPQQASSLASICWVDGEIVAYATATLTGTFKYTMSYIVRGAYDSIIGSHSVGSTFVRLDQGVLKIPFTQDRIGQVIYVKFLSFNEFGGGQISLADATQYTYTIQGTALGDDLDDVTNLAEVFVGNLAELSWTEITDFRPVLYEIRVGPTWATAQTLTRVAHPPYRVQGDGEYWVAGYSQPAAGLIVYSETPQGISVIGSNITANIAATRQEDPGYAGTVSGSVVKAGPTIQTTGTAGGYYTIPTGDRIIITYPFACAVIMKWTSSGSPLNNSIFEYLGPVTLSTGSTIVSGIQIFSGNGRLYGNQVIDNLNTTAGMGSGDYITGTGIPTGATVLAVTSTTAITMTLNATTGSTTTASTKAISVFPYLVVGDVIQSTASHVLPANTTITALSSTGSFSLVSISTTPLISSTSAQVHISINWFASNDFLGGAAAANVDIFPQIRMSQDGGNTWGAWQTWSAGYYVGNGFDARMSVNTNDVNTIGVLETWKFEVDVPDRVDHYTNLTMSSTGTLLLFRPDGGTTAAYNGGQGGQTYPTVLAAITAGGFGSVIVSSVSLNGAQLNCYSSVGVPSTSGVVNVVTEGW